MGDQHGISAWRWLFIIEGIISIVICGIVWFSLPRSAEQAWFLNEEEKALMRARKARDARFKGAAEFSWKFAKRAFTDPFVYMTASLLFASSIPLFGFTTFLPTMLRGLGHTGLEANYLSTPPYILASISLISWTTLSDKLNKGALVAMLAPLPCILGYIIIVGTPKGGAGYAAMFLCAAGIYPYNATLLTWVSNNLAPDDKRSVGIPPFASRANISGIVASQIYTPSGAPPT
ncbi:major facilitator superfamily domain-containing protein [Clohesyomyces aquaticus]|uniref:Major facilitator superfamily domain-containing protein n=1 Tax=Clohesyomyces aquaticus TaxID=1231657 RepID=A0A1Y2A9S1_9PLEO|nr:major facilitator superfamily domain-containing protein [Clohesyomyces aquaticus]